MGDVGRYFHNGNSRWPCLRVHAERKSVTGEIFLCKLYYLAKYRENPYTQLGNCVCGKIQA